MYPSYATRYKRRNKRARESVFKDNASTMKTSSVIAAFLGLYLLATWAVISFQDDVTMSREMPNKGERRNMEGGGQTRVKYLIPDGKGLWTKRGIHTNQSSPHHSIRRSASCHVPQMQRNGSLTCVVDTHKTICKQKCKFGHSLSDGFHERTMMCQHWQNKWKPFAEFEACKPFVDCEVSLKPGGFYRCYHPSNQETVCLISCAHFEDLAAVPEASYTCDIHGVWTPKLPFCAKAGKGQKLAPAPQGVWVVRD